MVRCPEVFRLYAPVAPANPDGPHPGDVVAQNGFELHTVPSSILRGRPVTVRAQPMKVLCIEAGVRNPRCVAGELEPISNSPHTVYADTRRVPICLLCDP